MCPEVDSASENEYQGFLLGVKATGACGWRPTTLVVPKVEKIRGRNLLGTPRTTSACRGTPLLLLYSIFFYIIQMSLTWTIGALTACAFFIGEGWDGRDVGGSFCGPSDLLHKSSAWCFSRTRTCEKTRACYIERNCWEGRCLPTLVALVVRACYDVMWCSNWYSCLHHQLQWLWQHMRSTLWCVKFL